MPRTSARAASHQPFSDGSASTCSPVQEAARLLSIQRILDAADLAQQAEDWELTTQLIDIAFAALDEASDPDKASSASCSSSEVREEVAYPDG